MQEKTKEQRKGLQDTNKRLENVALRRGLKRILSEAVWGCGAWLLGQAPMLFGTYPLGLAVLCASGAHTVSILLGLIASAFWQTETPTVYVCTYAIAAAVRIVSALIFDIPNGKRELDGEVRRKLNHISSTSKRMVSEPHTRSEKLKKQVDKMREAFLGVFTERVRLRMATGAVCSLIIGLYRIISNGFLYYDLFAAIFLVVVTPAAIFVYSASCGKQEMPIVCKRISQGGLLFSFVWAANGIAIGGFSLSVMLALFFTLSVTAVNGFALGAAAGMLAGLAYSPLYAPSFLLASLVYSLFKSIKGDGTGVIGACFAMLAWSSYVGGVESLPLLLPAALLSGTVATLFIRFYTSWEKAPASNSDADIHMRVAGNRHEDSNDRFRGISEAFSSLSEVFYNLSDRFRRPGTLDLRHICDRSFDLFCGDCPNKTRCWGLEYAATLDVMNDLISDLHTKGRVTREQIHSPLVHRCESMDAILEQINKECAKLTGEMLRNNRTEIFAMDYESAANIINDALEEDAGEYRFNPELEQKVSEYLSDAKIRAHSVTVYGTRRLQIAVRGVDVEHSNVSMDTLRSDLSEMCGLKLNAPVFEVEGKITTMTLQARKKLSVIGAQNNISADGGISGDTVNLFSNKKDYFYALVSDGMGAGREAAFTSNLCSVFLEKMLRAGNRAGTSLRMLNNMICSREADSTRECSSTVDLLELDLMTAEAAFIKSGAAPSFVVRGKVVHRLQSGTAPIGIIHALDVQSTSFSLRAGDMIVMVSDGILQNDPDCQKLMTYLSGVSALSPEEIVYHICLQASENDRHDDCSAIALKIQNMEE